MVIDRTHLALGTGSTTLNTTWENEFKNTLNALLDAIVDRTDGKITASNITIDDDATVAGDRTLTFKVDGSTQVILKYNSSTGRMRLENQTGTLVPLEIADATQTTQAVTKSQLDTGLAGVNAISATIRQAILESSLDTNGLSNALTPDSALKVLLTANSTTPFIVTWAQGRDSNGLPLDYTKKFTSNVTQTNNCDTVNRNYFFLTRTNSTTFELNALPYKQLLNVSYDTSRMLCHFNGSGGSTSFPDDYEPSITRWTAVASAALLTSSQKYGSACLDLGAAGTSNYITNSDIFQLNSEAFSITFYWKPASVDGTVRCLFGLFNTGGYGLRVVHQSQRNYYSISSGGTSWDVATSTAGTKTSYSTSNYYEITLDWDGKTYRAFVDGVLDFSVASTSPVVGGLIKNAVGAYWNGSSYVNFACGKFDELRILPYSVYRAGYTANVSAFTADTLYRYNSRLYKMESGNGTDGWVVTPALAVGEAKAGVVNSLLHFNGTNGSTTMTDVFGHTWTRLGTTALSTSIQKFGTASVQTPNSNGNGVQCLQANLRPSTNIWCVRGWFYPNSAASGIIFSWGTAGTHGMYIRWDGSSHVHVSLSSTGSSVDIGNITSSGTYATTTWHWIEVSWDGTTYRAFVNGTSIGTITSSTAIWSGVDRTIIGGFAAAAASPDAYLDDWMIEIGRIRNTSGYTAPVAQLSDTDYTLFSSLTTYTTLNRYTSPWLSYSVNSSFIVTHNIGHTNYRFKQIRAKCISNDAGYVVGDIVSPVMTYSGAPPVSLIWKCSSNSASAFISSSSLYGGGSNAFTASKWLLQVEFEAYVDR